jgi:hypothetical protein
MYSCRCFDILAPLAGGGPRILSAGLYQRRPSHLRTRPRHTTFGHAPRRTQRRCHISECRCTLSCCRFMGSAAAQGHAREPTGTPACACTAWTEVGGCRGIVTGAGLLAPSGDAAARELPACALANGLLIPEV